MGLDMYAFRVKKEYAINDFEFESDQQPAEDLAYWRKFNALHGWMEDLYRFKGGDKETFNCSPIRLTLEDLEMLEEDIRDNELQPRAGFFFGEQTIYPEDLEATQEFIKAAKQAIDEGDEVYYDSWW
jgi:hypothetical protein